LRPRNRTKAPFIFTRQLFGSPSHTLLVITSNLQEPILRHRNWAEAAALLKVVGSLRMRSIRLKFLWFFLFTERTVRGGSKLDRARLLE
ncbi:hypothetical protein, partial [uncultured Rikenella sp.]|uniref:hypothetical protein n=1 Tax=uncultured Rikenella sp. TaxID=368003 RepID=UPI00260DA0D6